MAVPFPPELGVLLAMALNEIGSDGTGPVRKGKRHKTCAIAAPPSGGAGRRGAAKRREAGRPTGEDLAAGQGQAQ